jgi:hypothetical protein
MAESGSREVLFEFVQLGNAVKVTAIDPATGTEASIVGSPAMSEAMLKRNALRKLDYVMGRMRDGKRG